jgi:ABC-type transport system involved in cytochrome bd biosynthesis fused ATPase/permease subunit
MIAGILGFACAIAIPVIGGYGLLVGLGVVDIPIVWIFVAFAGCAILRGILRYLEQYSGHYVAFRLLALFRDKVFEAMRQLAPAKMETRKSGDLVSLITSDIELLEVFYAHTIAPVVIAFVISLGMVIFIGSFHPVLGAFAAIAYITIGFVAPVIASRGTNNLGNEQRNAFSKVTTHFLDSIRGLGEIVQFGLGKERLAEIQGHSENLNDKVAAVRRHENRTIAISDGLVLLFSGGMFLLCVTLYTRGTVGMESVIIPTVAMFGSFGAVLAVGNLAGGLQGTFASARRVFALLDESPETEEIPGVLHEPLETDVSVDINNVSFSYGDKSILEDFNLDIKKGQTLGVMGPSGSGKSTLLRLIMRFWDVNLGSICLNGADIKKIPTKALRGTIGLLTQDTYIFNTTILENIRLGKPNASDEEVIQAANKASIHDLIIALEDGYKTLTGELGDQFSTGERQRIGLARMFLHNPSLMLLDEPTSNIDALNERVVLDSISLEKKEKTVIIVSHRKSTLTIADEVVDFRA